MHLPNSPLSLVALGCAAAATLILVGYLVLRPALSHATKVWLALGLGVLPIGAAAAGNVQGFEATKEREFCGSCHVMSLHEQDSADPKSATLAARHARNRMFGSENCYSCHADYGMFGTIVTKMGGMRHVWLYYTEYRTTPLDEAKRTIKIRRPFPNDNCMQCHSTEVKLWGDVPDHRALVQDLRAERVSCASAGCHGLAHPFFTPPSPSAGADAGASP
jgi:cytochrome c-type protein NapC